LGQDIVQSQFSKADHAAFRTRLREETGLLKRWFDERRFSAEEGFTAGLELEAWLLDANCLPTPHSDEFIATANDPRIVHELSKFNFELNVDPRSLTGDCLSATRADLATLWSRCRRAAETLGMRPMMIGILPTVRDEMLQLAWMAESNRYKALNEAIMHARSAQPLHIAISGADELDFRCDHIML
jgi:gamma-glutamyl:cysteine ligase YbdK (ATP-grasp superfamily)